MALVGLLFIIALWDIGKTAVKHARDDYGKSRAAGVEKAEKEASPASLTPPQRKSLVRRHATGYWLREVLGGFPVTRAGWQAGWIAHRAALAEEKAIREGKRTEHAEKQASLAEAVREHRRRQAEALGRAEREREAGGEATAPPLPSETVGQPEPDPYAPRDDARPDDSDWLRPGDERCPTCDGKGRKPGDKPPAVCPDCGGFGSPFPDDKAATNGNGSKPPATEGGHMPTGTSSSGDTTYYSVLADAKAAHAQSDEDTASIQKRMDDAYAAADQMAGANVDPAVIDAQMSYADSLKQALEALQAAGEHAGNTAAQAERYHGGMQEAVDSAPGNIAERQFHEGA